tara:strand:- start:519 stop:1154 length:636 start_codon:yes stop_codon:yes gene_type:complete
VAVGNHPFIVWKKLMINQIRIPRLDVSSLTPKQNTLVRSIINGKRGAGRPLSEFTLSDNSLRGPFNPWLQIPETGEHIQKLGESIRYNSSLPPTLRELAIITVAAYWEAQYEWWAHAQIAKKEGLASEVIEAVKAGIIPPEAEHGVQAVVNFVRETLHDHEVTDTTYQAVQKQLGNPGVVDLVTLIGYYCLVSATLNIFKVPLPDGETPPF